MLSDLVSECRIEVILGESALKDLLKDPAVHIAGVEYHRKAAEQSTSKLQRRRHETAMKHHSREAARLQRGAKPQKESLFDGGFLLHLSRLVNEGAGDPDLHTYSVELLGRKGRPRPTSIKAKEVEEYGSPGRSGVGSY